MSRIAVVVDSLADLPENLLNKHQIHVVPIKIRFGNVEYTDRVDLSTSEFYVKLEANDAFPKTSQPPPSDFINLYEQLLKDHDHILSLHISSKLSGTYASAVSAAARVADEKITVIDTKSGGLAEGIIAVRAAELVSTNANLEDVKTEVSRLIESRKIYVVFKSLDYIVKGGRLNKNVGRILTKLNLMPLITYTADGSLGRAGIVKNNSHTITKLIDRVAKELAGKNPTEIGIMHAAAPLAGKKMETSLKETFPNARVLMSEIGPGIGSYAGPGTVAIAYFTN